MDALVLIEMARNLNFTQIDDDTPEENRQIERRKALYMMPLRNVYVTENLLKIGVFKEHI